MSRMLPCRKEFFWRTFSRPWSTQHLFQRLDDAPGLVEIEIIAGDPGRDFSREGKDSFPPVRRHEGPDEPRQQVLEDGFRVLDSLQAVFGSLTEEEESPEGSGRRRNVRDLAV